jgi:hypothetical protein
MSERSSLSKFLYPSVGKSDGAAAFIFFVSVNEPAPRSAGCYGLGIKRTKAIVPRLCSRVSASIPRRRATAQVKTFKQKKRGELAIRPRESELFAQLQVKYPYDALQSHAVKAFKYVSSTELQETYKM